MKKPILLGLSETSQKSSFDTVPRIGGTFETSQKRVVDPALTPYSALSKFTDFLVNIKTPFGSRPFLRRFKKPVN